MGSTNQIVAGLLAHWPLAGEACDASGNGHDAVNRGADLEAAGPDGKPGGAAGFDGRGAHLEVPARPGLELGTGDFTVAAWLHTDRAAADGTGDLVSRYDPARRRGFHLSLKTNVGVTCSQPNFCQLQFGIDNNRETPWEDCGRPVASSAPFDPADYDLAVDRPLRIGFGAHDYFCGRLRDVRLYGRALSVAEVSEMARLEKEPG